MTMVVVAMHTGTTARFAGSVRFRGVRGIVSPGLVVVALVLVALVAGPVAGEDSFAGGELSAREGGPARAAAPEVSAASGRLELSGELFAGFWWVADESFSEFEIGRAELSSRFRPVSWGGFEVTAEAIRSASPQSVLGVDGDSLVLRLKRAWTFVEGDVGPVTLGGRAGLIPDPWVEALEGGYDHRGMSATLAERGAFFDTSDLGAAVTAEAWSGQARMHLSLTNGEGRNRVEQNSGKNVTVVLSLMPRVLETLDGPGVVGLHVTGRDGSSGTASIRSHRLAAALTWTHPRMNAGAEAVRAWGYAGRGGRETQGVGAWAGGTVWEPWIGLIGRADLLDMDRSRDDTWRVRGTGGIYSDPWRGTSGSRLRLYGLTQVNRAHASAAPIPGASEAFDDVRVMFLLSTRGAVSMP